MHLLVLKFAVLITQGNFRKALGDSPFKFRKMIKKMMLMRN